MLGRPSRELLSRSEVSLHLFPIFAGARGGTGSDWAIRETRWGVEGPSQERDEATGGAFWGSSQSSSLRGGDSIENSQNGLLAISPKGEAKGFFGERSGGEVRLVLRGVLGTEAALSLHFCVSSSA